MANISFTANTTADGEIRFTPNGKAVLNLNTAENHQRKNQSGSYEDSGTTFRRVTIWGKLAEHLADQVGKGSMITVQGREETRFYETKDGEKGKSLEVTADAIGVVYGKPVNGAPAASNTGGGYNGSGRPNPNQQADPWSQQGGGQYGWGNDQTEAPF